MALRKIYLQIVACKNNLVYLWENTKLGVFKET